MTYSKKRRKKRIKRWFCIMMAIVLLLAHGPPGHGVSLTTNEPSTVYYQAELEEGTGLRGLLDRLFEVLANSLFQWLSEEMETERGPPASLEDTNIPPPIRSVGRLIQFFPDPELAESVADMFVDRTVYCFVLADELAQLEGVLDLRSGNVRSFLGIQYLKNMEEILILDDG